MTRLIISSAVVFIILTGCVKSANTKNEMVSDRREQSQERTFSKELQEEIYQHEQQAKNGNVTSQYRLAKIHCVNAGSKKITVRKCLQWLNTASKNGHSQAIMDLADAYYYGQYNLTINLEKSVALYKEAANKSHPNAYLTLASLYGMGKGLPKSYELSFKYAKIAAEIGVPGAQYLLGRSYFTGQGTEKNIVAALQWLEKSSSNDYMPATFFLGSTYLLGQEVEAEPQRGFKLLIHAADRGHKRAKSLAGYAYAHGIGVEESHWKAYHLLSDSLEKDFPFTSDELDKLIQKTISSRHTDPNTGWALLINKDAMTDAETCSLQRTIYIERDNARIPVTIGNSSGGIYIASSKRIDFHEQYIGVRIDKNKFVAALPNLMVTKKESDLIFKAYTLDLITFKEVLRLQEIGAMNISGKKRVPPRSIWITKSESSGEILEQMREGNNLKLRVRFYQSADSVILNYPLDGFNEDYLAYKLCAEGKIPAA